MPPMPIHSPRIMLSNWFDAGLQCYALVDSSGNKQAVVEHVFSKTSNDVFLLYTNTDFDDFIKISPLLISLKRGDALIDWLIDEYYMTTPGSGIFLSSSTSARETIHHLQSMLEVLLPNHDTVSFRYYDPRVLHSYAHGVEEKYLSRIIGPMECVLWPYYRVLDKEWVWFGLQTGIPAKVERQHTYKSLMEITEEQLEAFADIHMQELAMRIMTNPATRYS